MFSASLHAAEVVAWICLVLGVLMLVTGVVTGLRISAHGMVAATSLTGDARTVLHQAGGQLREANRGLSEASRRLQMVQDAEMEGLGSFERAAVGGQMREAAQAAANSTSEAAASTEAATSAVQQIAGVVGALPERTRFAGLLILVGTVLVSVATIQFGGTSLL